MANINEEKLTVDLKNSQIQVSNQRYQNPIKYTKLNPYVLGKLYINKKFNTFYKIYKYGLCLFTAFTSLISLWFLTRWQTDSLSSLGLASITSNGLTANFGNSAFNKLGIGGWNDVYFPHAYESLLLSLSLINIFVMIYTLVFKNGTVWSISLISFLTITAFVVFGFFMSVFVNPTILHALNMYKSFSAHLNDALNHVNTIATTKFPNAEFNAVQKASKQAYIASQQKAIFDSMTQMFNMQLGKLLGYSVMPMNP